MGVDPFLRSYLGENMNKAIALALLCAPFLGIPLASAQPCPVKNLNYWQADPNEEPTQHAPEAPSEGPVAEPTVDPHLAQDDPINWEAAEYIHMEKGTGWFIIFIIVVLGLIALDIFLLEAYTFSVLVVVMAISIIVSLLA